jgi:hypothetical protein
VQEPRIEAEQRYDLVIRRERRVQRRVIVDAKIAPQPKHHGHPSKTSRGD